MKFCQYCDYRKGNKCSITGNYAEPDQIYQTSDKECPIRYDLEELSAMEDNIRRYERLLLYIGSAVRKVLSDQYHWIDYSEACIRIVEEYNHMKYSRDMWMHLCHIMIFVFIVEILCLIY